MVPAVRLRSTIRFGVRAIRSLTLCSVETCTRQHLVLRGIFPLRSPVRTITAMEAVPLASRTLHTSGRVLAPTTQWPTVTLLSRAGPQACFTEAYNPSIYALNDVNISRGKTAQTNFQLAGAMGKRYHIGSHLSTIEVGGKFRNGHKYDHSYASTTTPSRRSAVPVPMQMTMLK